MTAANPMRGEAQLGDKLLRVDFNGWCSLEGEVGAKVPDLLKDLQAGLGFRELRTWVRVFLVDQMPEDEVGDLIGSEGIEAAITALRKAIEGFFPPAKKAKTENPLRAA